MPDYWTRLFSAVIVAISNLTSLSVLSAVLKHSLPSLLLNKNWFIVSRWWLIHSRLNWFATYTGRMLYSFSFRGWTNMCWLWPLWSAKWLPCTGAVGLTSSMVEENTKLSYFSKVANISIFQPLFCKDKVSPCVVSTYMLKDRATYLMDWHFVLKDNTCNKNTTLILCLHITMN